MVVLGVDPGFRFAGFGVLKKHNGKSFLLDAGALKLSPSDSISCRIGRFYEFFDQKIITHSVTGISLETPFLGKNAQNFLKLGYLRGILYLLADKHKLSIFEFAPREVKLSVTGYGAAGKDQVARVVMSLFPGMAMPNKLDVTDALAVTICGMLKSSSAF